MQNETNTTKRCAGNYSVECQGVEFRLVDFSGHGESVGEYHWQLFTDEMEVNEFFLTKRSALEFLKHSFNASEWLLLEAKKTASNRES